MSRPISTLELSLAKTALEQEPELSHEEKQHYIGILPTLRVVADCDCGDPHCLSVRFEAWEAGRNNGFADGVHILSNNKEVRAILFLHEKSRQITELEVVD